MIGGPAVDEVKGGAGRLGGHEAQHLLQHRVDCDLRTSSRALPSAVPICYLHRHGHSATGRGVVNGARNLTPGKGGAGSCRGT